MPSGQPLSLYLLNSGLEREERRPRKGKRRPGAPREPREGWSKGPHPRAAAAAASGAMSDAEAAEAQALARVGQRKARRWMNDRLLREMCGHLTAAEMAALFQPAPWGERGVASVFSQATSPQHIQLWELFRSVDMDRESRVLLKWEAHVRELQAEGDHAGAAARSPAVAALASWAAVSHKARAALKRAPVGMVYELESQLLAFARSQPAQQSPQPQSQPDAGAPAGASAPAGPVAASSSCAAANSGAELVLEGLGSEDGFQRLLAHGLAAFHSLHSASRRRPDGTKCVVVRRRAGGAGELAPPETTAAGKAAGDKGGGAAAAAVAPLVISCCDILTLLEEGGGMNAAVVEDAYCHPGDCDTPRTPRGQAEQLAPRVAAVKVC
eukprot:scaffold3.g6276.t1